MGRERQCSLHLRVFPDSDVVTDSVANGGKTKIQPSFVSTPLSADPS